MLLLGVVIIAGQYSRKLVGGPLVRYSELA
jgi:hypothetical protein